MIEQFAKLSKTLDEKVPTLVDAIENCDATSTNYKVYLENLNATLSMMGVLNRTLLAVANKAEELKKEGNNNESNN